MRLREGVRETQDRDKRIVGCVMPEPDVAEADGGVEALLAELPAYPRGCLPDQMVPSTAIPLPEIPRTPNGKLVVQGRVRPVPGAAGLGEWSSTVTPSVVGVLRPHGRQQRRTALDQLPEDASKRLSAARGQARGRPVVTDRRARSAPR